MKTFKLLHISLMMTLSLIVLFPETGKAQAGAVVKQTVKQEAKQAAKAGVKQAVKAEIKQAVKSEVKQVVKSEAKQAIKAEMKQAVKSEVKQAVKSEVRQAAKIEAKKAVGAEAKAVVKAETKQLVRKEVNNAVKEETAAAMGKNAASKELPIATKRSLSADLKKGSFTKFSDNAKTAVTRAKIRSHNQYVSSIDFEKWAANPENKGALESMTFGKQKDGKVLRENMRRYMGESYKYAELGGNAAHHVVGGGKASAPARKILEKYGIDINDPRNGIFLPSSPESILKGTNHTGKHQNDYFNEVNRRLGEAKSKEQCLEILDDIKEELYKGKIVLQSDHKTNTILNSFSN